MGLHHFVGHCIVNFFYASMTSILHGVCIAISNLDIVLIFLYILALQEYWVLAESRIPLKLVLEGVRIVALSISSH